MSPRRAVAAGSMLALAAMVVAGCATPNGAAGPTPAPERPAPSYAALAEAHNTRVAKLRDLACPIGTIELHWIEDGKERWAQGDAEMWVRLPRHTALRVSKLGEDLLWLGSNDDRYWLFDLLDDETVLITAPHERSMAAFGGSMLPARPLALLDLIGITPLPVIDTDAPPVTWDEAFGGWAFEVTTDAGRIRAVFDSAGRLPIVVTAIGTDGDDAGQTLATSQLREYSPVPIDGLNVLDHPLMAQVIEISDRRGGRVELFLRRWSGRADDLAGDQLFELDRLRRAMPPDDVVGEPSGVAGAAGAD